MPMLVPVDATTYQLPNGGTVTFDSPDSARWAMMQMQGRQPGGLDVGIAVDAAEAAFAGLTAAQIKEMIRDAQEDRRRVRRAQDDLLDSIRSNSSLGPDIAAQFDEVFRRQRQLDRSQTEAASRLATVQIVQALGGGVQVLSKLAGGSMFGESIGGGGSGMGTVLAGGAIGAGLVMLFTDDDDDDRGRRRR